MTKFHPISRLRFSFPVRMYERMTMFDSPAHVGDDRYEVDFIVPVGTEVLAAADGVVISLKDDSDVGGFERRWDEWGNGVDIRHVDGLVSTYEHLKCRSVIPKVGEHVRRGQVIGLSGATGWIAHLGPHLHFGVGRMLGKPPRFVSTEIQWDPSSPKPNPIRT